MNHELNRRDFLVAGAVAGGAAALSALSPGSASAHTTDSAHSLMNLVPGAIDGSGAYVLPPLRYGYDAVKEVIDEETMRLHHDKHHAGYVAGLIAAEKALAEARAAGNFDLVDHWSRQSAFHGGGHFLHCLFWDSIGPPDDGEGSMGGKPTGDLAKAIDRDFGGFDAMWSHLAAASKRVEGSGWGLLAFSFAAQKLVILGAQNQQLNTQWGIVPILGIDVWEHAYYLKYKNNRGAYVDAFPAIINWVHVAEKYALARG